MANPSNPNNDMPISHPPGDSVSALNFSPTSNLLVAGSWDTEVRLWDVQQTGQAVPKASMKHAAPVLCASFSRDGNFVFSGSCDKTAKMWNVQTGQEMQIAAHDAPIKEIFQLEGSGLVVTGSWDCTLRYWDVRTNKMVARVALPERVYSMDTRGGLVVVGMANRHVHMYNTNKLDTPFRTMESPLKMQTRTVACFADAQGYAIGSIEGRVAIRYCDTNSQKNFAFKCHRHKDEVYAINKIAFHPLGTFATCGSDGAYTFWNKDTKQRLKNFKPADQPITTCAFSGDGNIFAYALSYDWSKGVAGYDRNRPAQIMLHRVQQQEMQPPPRTS